MSDQDFILVDEEEKESTGADEVDKEEKKPFGSKEGRGKRNGKRQR